MKNSSYLLRIDDVCPTMRRSSFERIRAACDELNIKPVIGVVPDNQDAKLRAEEPWEDFWPLIKNLGSRGWIIAQHGYQHIYGETKTEFAGLPYEEQKRKISLGRSLLIERIGITPNWFMAPAHSLDDTTCKVLEELSFTHITDGVALYPFMQNNLTWVPQQLWRPRSMPFGLWTICLHPNTMSDSEIDTLIAFMKSHQRQFQNISLDPQNSLLTSPMRFAWNIVRLLKHV
jgi:predicted deacetylase